MDTVQSRGTLKTWEVNPWKTQEVHQGQVCGPAPGSGQSQYQYKLRDEWIEGSPDEKGLAVLVEEKFDMIWQSVLAARKVNHILSCTKSSVASTWREMIFPIYSLLSWDLTWSRCPALGPSTRKNGYVRTNPEDWHKNGQGAETVRNREIWGC